MKKKSAIKLLAILATGLGFAATLLSDWSNKKEQEALIEEKVNEALAKQNKKQEDEEES